MITTTTHHHHQHHYSHHHNHHASSSVTVIVQYSHCDVHVKPITRKSTIHASLSRRGKSVAIRLMAQNDVHVASLIVQHQSPVMELNGTLIILESSTRPTIIRLAQLQCESLLFRSSRLSSVCLCRFRSRKLSEIGAKFRRLLVLSHWPHVATHVATQVAQLVASVKGLGHKLPNLLLNVSECRMCGNKLRASAASSIFRRHVESHGYSLPIRKWNS